MSDDVDTFLFGAKMVIRKCALANTLLQATSHIILNLVPAPTSQETASMP
jgi:hypothetical protein